MLLNLKHALIVQLRVLSGITKALLWFQLSFDLAACSEKGIAHFCYKRVYRLN